MSGQGGDLPRQSLGLGGPAEQGRPLLDEAAPPRRGDNGVKHTAPQVEEQQRGNAGKHDEKARDRGIELQYEGNAQVGEKPEGGALEDDVERLVAAQEQAFVVEVEVRKGPDQKRRAQQQQRQIVAEARAGHFNEDRTEGRVVPDGVTDEQPCEHAQRVAREENGRQRLLAERFLGGRFHRGAEVRRSRLPSTSHPGR